MLKKMITDNRQKLSITESQMPLARFYYDYPLYELPESVLKEITGAPFDYQEAIPAQSFLEWLKPKGEYTDHENGYCMFPDGSGYISTYMKIPENVEPKKIFWYLNWLNTHPKSQPEGSGNLRYKIWNPCDHWDHYFINWEDKSEGIVTTESLDLGNGERKYNTIRHSFNLREYGLEQERIDKIKASGIELNETSDWESFDFEGAHLTLGQIREGIDGQWERRSVEWIGWRPKDGKIIRVPKTPCDEAFLRKVAVHTLTEWYHLMTFINDLYDTYSKLPKDAD